MTERGGVPCDIVEVLELLWGRLRRRRKALAQAVDGQVVTFELVVGGTTPVLLLLAPDGQLTVLDSSVAITSGWRPSVTLGGQVRDLVAYVLGEVDTAEAAFRGLLHLHVVDVAELTSWFPTVMRVVAEEVCALIDEHHDRRCIGDHTKQ